MRSETSFDLDGDLIFVDAVVVGPSGQADVRLVLDTGAVLTTLVPRVVESIGYTAAARVARSVIRSAVASSARSASRSRCNRRSSRLAWRSEL
jgi:predicted aspartyl protease